MRRGEGSGGGLAGTEWRGWRSTAREKAEFGGAKSWMPCIMEDEGRFSTALVGFFGK